MLLKLWTANQLLISICWEHWLTMCLKGELKKHKEATASENISYQYLINAKHLLHISK